MQCLPQPIYRQWIDQTVVEHDNTRIMKQWNGVVGRQTQRKRLARKRKGERECYR